MTNKSFIQTDKAPKAIGPYSQGISFGDLVFLSGQIPLVPETGKMITGSVKTEVAQIFKNIGAILKSKNLTYGNILKTTIFLTDMSLFNEVNEEYAKYFSESFPARSCVGVSSLPRNARVEIEVVAHM